MNSKFLLQITLFLVLIMNNANAKIIEIDDISKVPAEIFELDSNDLVTIDVRNVLFGSQNIILKKHFKKEFKKIISDLREKFGDVEAERLHSIILKDYIPINIDPNMPKFIKKIQDKHIKIIAVTSGKIGKYGVIENREDLRIKKLKTLGYDFSNSFAVNNIILEEKPDEIPLVFKNGILFNSNALKGISLGKFLDHIQFKPKTIVHIDNSMRMLINMEKYCKENNIKFLGVHFTKVFIKSVEVIDKKVVDKQFKILQTEDKWITDAVARCLVDHNLTTDQCIMKVGK